ncbi:MAG: hypothetical protein VXZ83_04505 [Verrucomicrobiota bacterium]|nr:hypothetical protein [Verrucomicrobiota bacterium]
MADTNNTEKEIVKVEDLLRLKRLERPDQDFWSSFDRELHQRMLQALVKKDPWYAQIVRGLSGRLAQTTAVGAAAAFLAMMILRPALVDSVQPKVGAFVAQQSSEIILSDPILIAMPEAGSDWVADYQIEAISADSSASDLGYTQDYLHDRIEVTAYDRAAYIVDTASFASTSVAAGLVY